MVSPSTIESNAKDDAKLTVLHEGMGLNMQLEANGVEGPVTAWCVVAAEI